MDDYNIILASGSPRRQELLQLAKVSFKVHISEVDETMPDTVPIRHHAKILAHRKAETVGKLYPEHTVIGADTTVILGNSVINKPTNKSDAINILSKLSNNMHEVITGVCIVKEESIITFEDITRVYFKKLTLRQIEYYIDNYKPYDKAGAYAIQEWIGLIGIEKIEGDYFNVMGLPVNRVMDILTNLGVILPV